MKNGNKRILCVSKFHSRWHTHLCQRFLYAGYELKFIYIDKVCSKIRFSLDANKKMVEQIVFEANLSDSKYILYDMEFVPQLFPWEITEISEKTSTVAIGLALDDDSNHYSNRFIYSSINKILSNSPQSESLYIQLSKNALCILPLELPMNTLPQMNIHLKKDHVLIYGDLKKADRPAKINALKKSNIPLHILEKNLPYEEVYKYINEAKIVLNFSKSINPQTNLLAHCPNSFLSKVLKGNLKFNYQAKGRIFEAAYLNSICVSEYFPLHEKLLSKNAMPIFTNDFEMIKITKRILEDDDYLRSVEATMQSEMANRYTLEKISLLLDSFIASESTQKSISCQLPFTLITAIIVNKASYLKNPWVCIECGIANQKLSDFCFIYKLLITGFSFVILALNTIVYGAHKLFEQSDAN